jgi:hypothetical protein
LPAALYVGGMKSYTFLYRCPTTGHRVQGLVRANAHPTDEIAAYETVTCLACSGVHLVNPSSGRVLGAGTTPDHRTPHV